ncbi:hypothetical protein ACFSJ1_26915 [Trinickia caryophylli]|uniref:hypothetical protein n=1 Tax=Trinickia caryophylli TaxID=28094 RepID=UPI0036297732
MRFFSSFLHANDLWKLLRNGEYRNVLAATNEKKQKCLQNETPAAAGRFGASARIAAYEMPPGLSNDSFPMLDWYSELNQRERAIGLAFREKVQYGVTLSDGPLPPCRVHRPARAIPAAAAASV